MTRPEPPPVDAATLRALAAAIDINDLIDPDAPPPRSLALDVSGGALAECFRLSRQFWREAFDPPALARLIAPVLRGQPLGKRAREEFKQVRAAVKHLRFAFFLYDARHRAPPALSLLALVMGELQDAARVGRTARALRNAAVLRILLSGPCAAVLRREAERFRPSDAAGFDHFTASQVESLRPLLASAEVGAHGFHAARKVVSRRVSFHDDMRTLHPEGAAADRHRASARWFATLNGLMGALHDELIARDAAGLFRYRRDTFALPEPIRARLATLAALPVDANGARRVWLDG